LCGHGGASEPDVFGASGGGGAATVSGFAGGV
jgi:hypothetical protein